MPTQHLYLQTFVKRIKYVRPVKTTINQYKVTPAVIENKGVNLFSVVAGK